MSIDEGTQPPVPYEGTVPFAEVYLPKISATLSIVGSALVLVEVLLDRNSGRCSMKVSDVTSRTLMCVSIGDIIFSM